MHIFLTLALAGGERSASRPGGFTSGESAPDSHGIGCWVDPSAGVDGVKERKFFTLLGLELRTLGRPARSQSLYLLRYPGSYKDQGRGGFHKVVSMLRCLVV
jgi:hypothetical protein